MRVLTAKSSQRVLIECAAFVALMLMPCAAMALAIARAMSAHAAVVQAGNPFAGKRMYVNPNSDARRQADEWSSSRSDDAALMRRMADQPQAVWFGDWNRDPRGDIDQLLSAARGALVVLSVYNIPYRDCGLYSRGGAGDADGYRRWIIELARGIRNRPIAVVLEPDALPGADCLPARLRDERFILVRDAADVLKKAGAFVYLDAGNAAWKQPQEMATRLNVAGVSTSDGFSLNVSNFQGVAAITSYGDRLSGLIGGKHYIIDTSRNGRGTGQSRAWCNPRGQALGPSPASATGHALVDAFLWVKVPGQSDGTCNGGPNAGKWWPEYALELAKGAAR